MLGLGFTDQSVSEAQARELVKDSFASRDMIGKKILCIIPDHTRTAPIDLMFRLVYAELAERVEQLDFIIALGTHPPMSDEAINHRVGITQDERTSRYPRARFFNHHWQDPDQLQVAGTFTAEDVAELSGGLIETAVDVTINKMVYDYDLLLIIGPTFPHEVVGFSGGNKYLFPGIAGQEIIDMFHWLGALITNPMIIGHKYTPVRAVVDRAAAFLPVERMCMSLVVKGCDLAGLYIGTPEDAWEAASDLSDKLHIVYTDRAYHTVLSRAPEMYDELWTGGKCMYKLEPVVADGGDLIIYAPHITQVSEMHGKIIEKIGYHVRDYFVKQPQRFLDIPGGVMAHSTHVKGIGKYENGVETPRINVILATGISEATCRKINLGYRDPASINIEDYMNQEDQGVLYVPKAGEMLYRLKANNKG
ncbi:MAG: lactate racemase domain-containing protein [Candidatus Marinimicrobia bacterium]|nr:lactate racemase domain-containing protein [Candidatus Neomarinimicrobiota bacterium]